MPPPQHRTNRSDYPEFDKQKENQERLSDDDIQRIVEATQRNQQFQIDPKAHYDQHQRLDRMLEAYESAQSQFWKWLLGIILAGGLFFAGVFTKVKGMLGL